MPTVSNFFQRKLLSKTGDYENYAKILVDCFRTFCVLSQTTSMALDPKTLKVGDRVNFGPGVTLVVEQKAPYAIRWEGEDTVTCPTEFVWKLATKVGPILPRLNSYGFTLRDDNQYSYTGIACSPEILLLLLKKSVKKLVEAGVVAAAE